MQPESLFRLALTSPDPDAPFVGWPLKRVCDEVEEWVPGVVFLCDNNFGGIGNVRNFILTCVRYAIEAGATGLVMPAIRKRRDDDIRVILDHSDFRPFSYLFDEDNFRQAMGESCPQITLYDDWTRVPRIQYLDNEPEVQEIDPRQMGRIEGAARDAILLSLITRRILPGPDFESLSMIPRTGTPFATEYTSLPRDRLARCVVGVACLTRRARNGQYIRRTVQVQQTIMQLGKKVLANMQTFARAQNTQPRGSSSGFFGVHLQSEADAEPFWPSYEEQEVSYLRKAEESQLTVGYLASGNLTEARRLVEAAKKQNGMTLRLKDDLLEGDDLGKLHSLSWDQRGLVDYIVLADAEYFAGNSRSSFSISICQKRHLKAEGLYSRPYKVRENGYGRSFVVGPMEDYYEHWLFIWDAMWP
ncbi:hypothetical protein OPQ81_008083 [Rhizoctonia solani]|nr:hypothetical protein OPQ81_008083 [Rhizoctonia solani]